MPYITAFDLEWQRYVLTLATRKTLDGTEQKPVAIRSCIPTEMLQAFIAMKYIDAASVEVVTDENVKTFIKTYGARGKERLDVGTVDAAVKAVKMTWRADDLPGAVRQLAVDLLIALSKAGFKDFTNDHEERSITYLWERLQPTELRTLMKGEAKLNPKITKDSFTEYVDLAAKVAATVHPHTIRKPATTTKSSGDSAKKDTSKKTGAKETEKKEKTTSVTPRKRTWSKSVGEASGKSDGGGLVCWNDRCKGPHLLRDCPDTSANEKKKILEARYGKRTKK